MFQGSRADGGKKEVEFSISGAIYLLVNDWLTVVVRSNLGDEVAVIQNEINSLTIE